MWYAGSGNRVEQTSDISVSLHVDVDEVPLAEVVKAVLKQVVLCQAAFHCKTPFFIQHLVCVNVLILSLSLAVLDSFPKSVNQSPLFEQLRQILKL